MESQPKIIKGFEVLRPFGPICFYFGGSEESSPYPKIPTILLRQVHGNKIHEIKSRKDAQQVSGKEGDGIICNLSGLKIGIKTADCVPILLAHPSGVIAALHAGWRGTRKKIVHDCLNRLSKSYGLALEDLKVAIGPAICQNCYEVGPEVADQFDSWVQESYLLKRSNGKFSLNLRGVNLQLLLAAGIPEDSIFLASACTRCNDADYHSHRGNLAKRIDSKGRNLSWALIEGSPSI